VHEYVITPQEPPAWRFEPEDFLRRIRGRSGDWGPRLGAKVAEHFAGVSWPQHSLVPRRSGAGAQSNG
jgi:hypothetical protein